MQRHAGCDWCNPSETSQGRGLARPQLWPGTAVMQLHQCAGASEARGGTCGGMTAGGAVVLRQGLQRA